MGHDEALRILQVITAAFDAHDLDGILSHFADDAVFDSPRGPDPWVNGTSAGRRFRDAFAARFSGIPKSATSSTNTSSTVIEGI